MSATVTPPPGPEPVPAGEPTDPPTLPWIVVATWGAGAVVVAVYALLLTYVAPELVDARPNSGVDFLPHVLASVKPEPLEQLRYVLAATIPLAVAGLTFLLVRSPRRPDAGWDPVIALGIFALQIAAVGFVGAAWGRQQLIYSFFAGWQAWTAVIVAVAVVAAIIKPGPLAVPARLRALRTRPLPGWLPTALAGLFTLAAVSFAVFRDGNVVDTLELNVGHWPVFTEEITAVAQGRTPLVDFVPQYTSILPYLGIPFLDAFTPSLLTVSTFIATLSAIAFFSVYIAFRILTEHRWWACGFYIVFLSIAMYPNTQDGPHLHALVNYWGVMPMRYIGPFVTLAVLAWTLRAPSRPRFVALGLASGLSLLNNFEFGLPVLLGAILAVAAAGAPDRPLAIGARIRDLLGVAAGVAIAVVAFCSLTLVRSGELPDVWSLLAFARQFAAAGFFMLPMPGFVGLHTLIWATFVICIVVALVQALTSTAREGAAGRVTVGLLAFSGVFGLGALTYYVGRSAPTVLIALFAAWAISLTVLTWEVVLRLRATQAGSMRQYVLLIPAVVLIGHLTLAATTLSDDRGVFGQPGRLLDSGKERIYEQVPMRNFVADCTNDGEATMLLYPLGYRIAASAGVENWMPYNHPESIVTQQQVDRVGDVIRDRGVSVVYSATLQPAMARKLRELGFRAVRFRQDTTGTIRIGLNNSRELRSLRRADTHPPSGCTARP